MLINIGILIVGFVLLIKGADFLVGGASGIADRLHVPQIIIGLTIVAFGTSAPEAAISIQAALKDEVGITIGNVLGSNILNIFLILGVTAALRTIHVERDTIKKEIPFVAVITAIFLVLGFRGHLISRVNGAIFWGLLVLFMMYTFKKGKDTDPGESQVGEEERKPVWLLAFLFVLGIGMVVFGSDLIVDAASYIASTLGMSERLIGLTIVAFGTSLPELVTSLAAVRADNSDIAIGNVVGSNIFNILFIVGTVALIHPIPFPNAFIIDSLVAFAAAVLLYVLSSKDGNLNRKDGILFLLCYIVYTGYLIAG